MRWGDIVRVDFNPVVGSEATKVRPALLVSNDAANRAVTSLRRGVLTVLPITSNVTRIFPFQVLLPARHSAVTGLKRDSKIQAEQIRAVDLARVTGRFGRLPPELRDEVEDALSIHLDIDQTRWVPGGSLSGGVPGAGGTGAS